VQFRFIDHILDVERRELRRGSKLVSLEPQVFDLLAYLITQRDRVVSKDDLLNAVWDGRVVSDATLASRIASARRAIADNGGAQRLIRTIHGRGVRFVGELLDDPPAEPRPAPPQPLLGRPLLVVLPFSNLGNDPEQEHIADGITEDITTAVGCARWFLVIGRNSAFAYKGRTVDLQQVGRELGVRYVLQGSVRRAGGRLRITAQLSETETGTQVWARRYDEAWENVFELQDRIAESVAAAIEPELRDVEIVRALRRPPGDLNAYDHYLRAAERFYRAPQDSAAERLREIRGSLALYPDYAPLHALAAQCLVYYVTQGYSDDRARDCTAGAYHARTAVALDNNDPNVLAMAGHALGYHAHDWETSIRLLERALAVNPSSAFAHMYAGWGHIYGGVAEQALYYLDRSLQLSPIDRHGFLNTSGKAIAFTMLGRYEEAVSWGRRAVQEEPGWTSGYRPLAASLAQLGRLEEAQAVMRQLLEREPHYRISKSQAHFKQGEGLRRYTDGLLKAGGPP
jgi:adenylate cyclase